MRRSLIAAASAALALSLAAAPAALAQAQSPTPGAPAQGAAKPKSGAPMVRSVNIVDLAELPAEAKPQIEEAAAKASKEDLEGLRTAIDRSPEIKKALEAKGATSAEVVVANLDQEGTLTLITKKRA